MRLVNVYARGLISVQASGATRVQADKITLKHMTPARLHKNSIACIRTAERVFLPLRDRKTSHAAAGAIDAQTIAWAAILSVNLNHWVSTETRLRPSINFHGLRDRRQWRERIDNLYSTRQNIEVDDISATGSV